MNIVPLINYLSKVKTYKLMIIVVLLSELFTAIMNSIHGYLWWGRIDVDLLVIGSIDALIVSFLVGGLLVLLLNFHRRDALALNESQEHFKQLVDNIPICLALVDSDENIFYMNEHLTKTMGYTVKDVPDMSTWWRIGYPDEQYRAEVIARWSKAVTTALTTGNPIVPEEYNVTCKDGSVLVMEIFGAPVGNKHLVIFNDKTAQKNHERQLMVRKEQYEKVLESSPVGITVFDSTGECITANPAMADIVGATHQQMLQQNYHTIESWKHSGLYDTALLALENNKPEQIYAKLVSTFGKSIYVSCYMVPFVPDGLLIMAYDLSKLREAEDELIKHKDNLEHLVQQRSEELANSEKRYRELINNTETGFVVVDEKGIVLEANEPYLNLTGRSSIEDILGHSVIEWAAPECTEENAAGIAKCIENGYLKDFEATNILPDGSRRNIQIDATVQRKSSGIQIHSFCRDVTERKKAAEAIVASHQQLRNLITHRDELLEEERRHISREIHDEMGQQLTAMKMDITRLSDMLTDEQEDLLSLTGSMFSTVTNAIKSVQRVSRAIRPVMLDTLGIVSAMENEINTFTASTSLECRADIDIGEGSFDKPLALSLYRILQESLTNVARHADATKVHIDLRRHNGQVALEITDNGRGITEDELSAPDAYGLIGMYERANLLDGTLNIESHIGKGTKLKLCIPIKDDPND